MTEAEQYDENLIYKELETAHQIYKSRELTSQTKRIRLYKLGFSKVEIDIICGYTTEYIEELQNERVQQRREAKRKTYAKLKEQKALRLQRLKQQQKAWREANKEKMKAYQKEYWLKRKLEKLNKYNQTISNL